MEAEVVVAGVAVKVVAMMMAMAVQEGEAVESCLPMVEVAAELCLPMVMKWWSGSSCHYIQRRIPCMCMMERFRGQPPR
jgi:hypothetical protein